MEDEEDARGSEYRTTAVPCKRIHWLDPTLARRLIDRIACSIRRHPTGFAEWTRISGTSNCHLRLRASLPATAARHIRFAPPQSTRVRGHVEADLFDLTGTKKRRLPPLASSHEPTRPGPRARRPATPSREPLHLVVFVRLVGRCSKDATGTLRVEHEQAAAVPARRVPFAPRPADQRVAVDEDRRFLVRERLQPLRLVIVEGDGVPAVRRRPTRRAVRSRSRTQPPSGVQDLERIVRLYIEGAPHRDA